MALNTLLLIIISQCNIAILLSIYYLVFMSRLVPIGIYFIVRGSYKDTVGQRSVLQNIDQRQETASFPT